jgi:hypothetical protein
MKKVGSLDQRRAFKRIQARLKARFFFGKMFYHGVVTNLSESGMFICTKMCLPSGSRVGILINTEKELFNVSIMVKRTIKTDGSQNGIGVEILNDPPDYLEFINNMRSVL